MKARLVEPHDCPHQVKFMPAMAAVGHLVGVGIGIGDERVLAAELEHDGLDGLGRGPHHRAPGRHTADQRHLGNARMRGECLADLSSARHDVEHAGRQHAIEKLGKAQR